HECDVAVIDRQEAMLCRAEQVHPRASKVLIASECKFYTAAVQLALGRGFLGLTSDIHRNERYFVTNGQSASVTKLIAHHKVHYQKLTLTEVSGPPGESRAEGGAERWGWRSAPASAHWRTP